MEVFKFLLKCKIDVSFDKCNELLEYLNPECALIKSPHSEEYIFIGFCTCKYASLFKYHILDQTTQLINEIESIEIIYQYVTFCYDDDFLCIINQIN